MVRVRNCLNDRGIGEESRRHIGEEIRRTQSRAAQIAMPAHDL